jgi:hypothetical protein
MKLAEVVKKGEKEFEVVLGGQILGTTKTDFDARFHMHAINDALNIAYLEGQKYLEHLVVRQRLESELQAARMQARAEYEKERMDYERG